MKQTIKVLLDTVLARVPKQNGDSAGYDFWGVRIDDEFNKTFTVSTDVRMIIPKGKVGILKERSSIGVKGCKLLAGVIDSDYRGVIKVVYPIEYKELILDMIHNGKAIAQMVIVDYCSLETEVVSSGEYFGNTTARGDGGFGSSDKS